MQFQQPDTMIPNLNDPLSWNRYSYVKYNPVNSIDPTGHKEIECDGEGTCLDIRDLQAEYNRADTWQYAELTFDEFVVGYGSYQYFMNHPEEALQNAISDTDEYYYADMYSEYVLHQMFQPFGEGPVMVMAEKARQAGDAPAFYGSMLWLFSPLFFEAADKGMGGSTSTGRSNPVNLKEQLAMEAATSNPQSGIILPVNMTDPRWPAADGWVKMSQNINGIEIHYVRNTLTGAVADFKFK